MTNFYLEWVIRMYEIRQQNRKVVVVLHEIYGINDHIKNYAKRFTEFGFDVVCPNLLKNRNVFSYEEERQAYENFRESGFDVATKKLTLLIKQLLLEYKELYIVGFSVGATLAWLCSEIDGVRHVIGYYGSRIRDYLVIHPTCPVTLFYGKIEKSFDVLTLIESLNKKDIEVYCFEGEHGFADVYSKKYHAVAHDQAFKKVQQIIL